MHQITTSIFLAIVFGGISLADRVYYERRSTSNWPVVFLVNCWGQSATSVGARSEVVFYTSYSSLSDSARPVYIGVAAANSNFVWENGGAIQGESGITFTWIINNPVAAANASAGYGSYGGQNYIIYKQTGTVLYNQIIPNIGNEPLDCHSIYCARYNGTAASTSTLITTSFQITPTSAMNIHPSVSPGTTATPSSVASTAAFLSLTDHLVIGIGSSAFLVLIITFLTLCLRQKRRSSRTAVKSQKDPQEYGVHVENPYGVSVENQCGVHVEGRYR